MTSRLNQANMVDLDYEKARRLGNMYGDAAVLDRVTQWRRPDLVFDEYVAVDLGGKTVECWHFGPGNGPGDTIVYSPAGNVAWTGNFLCHAGIAPMLLQGGPDPYVASLLKMKAAMPDLRTVVPGHGPMGDGHEAIDWLVNYLRSLRESVGDAMQSGLTVQEAMEECWNPFVGELHPSLAEAVRSYGLPVNRVVAELSGLMNELHRLNVLATFRALEPRITDGAA